MSSQVWRIVYQTVRQIDKKIPQPKRRPEFSDVLIVAMYLWAAAHDRPQGWACRRSSYGSMFRPRRLPSQSRFSRRLRNGRCYALLDGVYRALARTVEPTPVATLDGRPFPVGACSKDREARAGRIRGGFARGYRLHQIVTEDQRVLCWSVTAMNVSEEREARTLIPATTLGRLLLADAVYDSSDLYDLAEAQGSQLVAGIRAHRCHSALRTRHSSPARLRAVRAWTHGVAKYVHRDRTNIERVFAQQSSYGGGLGPLPAWVRSLPRVRRWIGAKLILHHARLIQRSTAA